MSRIKLTTAVATGLLGLAVTGGVALAAFQPSEPGATTTYGTEAPASARAALAGTRDRIKAVLDKLVQSSTITQAQEDAIVQAFKDARQAQAHPKIRAALLRDILKDSADYLGIPLGQLRQQLADGKTLGQIANETAGKSRQGLIDALVADVSAQVDKLVSEHKITAERAAKIKAALPGRIAKIVDRTFKKK